MKIVCDECGGEFSLKELDVAEGRCPKCGETVMVSKYCHFVPEKRFWRLYSAAPVSVKILVVLYGLFLALSISTGIARANCATGLDVIVVLGGVSLACAFFVMLMSKLVQGKALAVTIFNCLMSGVSALIALGCFVNGDGGVVSVSFGLLAGGLFLVPLFLPSTRKWIRERKTERLAYRIARTSRLEMLSVKEHDYKCKPMAIVLFFAIVSLFGVVNYVGQSAGVAVRRSAERCAAVRVLAEWKPEGQRIDKALADAGINDFLQAPADYLVATNGVEETKAMLARGVEIAQDAVAVCDRMLSSRLEFMSGKDRQDAELILARCREMYESLGRLFRRSQKIIAHFEQRNLGDPDGILKREFGTNDEDVIWEKLVGELSEWDKMFEDYLALGESLSSAHSKEGEEGK